MKHIAIITPGFSASEQDWCIPALLDLVRKLSESCQVHVFTLRYPHFTGHYSIYGANVTAFGGAERSGIYRLLLIRRAINAIIRVHQQRPFELIHAFWADEPGYIAVRAAKRLGIPAVVSILGGELVHLKSIKYGHQGSFAARWLIERSIKQADAVTVGSKRLYEIAKARVDTHRLKIAPLGVDTELFTPSSHEISDSKRLLNVASLSPVKNQHFLLRVFAKVLDHLPNTHLDIVGDGSERAALEKLVERLGIRTQVTFHGDISHEQLPAFYQSAALCLLTSHHESQSLVALEAAACQKLTVGTPVGILPELVPEQYLSPDEDVLAKQIVGLLTDAEQREHLAQVAYERVMRYFSLDASIVRWREMYNAISSELSK